MPIDHVTVDEIRGLLASPESIRADAFGVLKRITSVLNAAEGAEDASKAQELILLALDRKAEFARCEPVLYGLVREVGLFPYLEPDELGLADRIAYEFHRPLNTGDWDVVFHRPQARVYRELISGRSVVLSAPTSFGKSLVIDAVVASGQYKNILVIVPTIALIDETRRRLARFRDAFKVITHPAQGRLARNIFILTQERVLELHDLDRIDFFVLDEFYKLSPTRGEDGRSRPAEPGLVPATQEEQAILYARADDPGDRGGRPGAAGLPGAPGALQHGRDPRASGPPEWPREAGPAGPAVLRDRGPHHCLLQLAQSCHASGTPDGGVWPGSARRRGS